MTQPDPPALQHLVLVHTKETPPPIDQNSLHPKRVFNAHFQASFPVDWGRIAALRRAGLLEGIELRDDNGDIAPPYEFDDKKPVTMRLRFAPAYVDELVARIPEEERRRLEAPPPEPPAASEAAEVAPEEETEPPPDAHDTPEPPAETAAGDDTGAELLHDEAEGDEPPQDRASTPDAATPPPNDPPAEPAEEHPAAPSQAHHSDFINPGDVFKTRRVITVEKDAVQPAAERGAWRKKPAAAPPPPEAEEPPLADDGELTFFSIDDFRDEGSDDGLLDDPLDASPGASDAFAWVEPGRDDPNAPPLRRPAFKKGTNAQAASEEHQKALRRRRVLEMFVRCSARAARDPASRSRD